MTSTPARTRTARSGTGGRVARRSALGRAAAVLALVVAASGGLAAGPAAPADAEAPPVAGVACAPGQGVTVVVDFNGLPGGIRIGCAVGEQVTGLAALAAAGFAVGMGDAPGVVCTIDGAPVEGYPFCWLTGGYWSYWRAPRGGSWAFSPVGAGAGPLPIDSVEGWSWAPGFTSQAPRADESSAPPPTTTTTTTTTTSTTSVPTNPTNPTSSTAPGSATPTTRPATTASSTPGSTPAATAATAPTTTPATTTPATATSGPGAIDGSGAVSPGRSTTPTSSGGTLARTGSDARTPVVVALLVLLAGIVLVAASRRLASSHG